MSVTRVPQFPESVIRRGQANARNDLDVYSRGEVDAEIGSIDLSPYATNSTVASISGGLDTRIDALEGTVITLDANTDALAVDVQSISAALTTDIENLDLSLTQKIAVDCLTSEAVSGSASTVTGYLKIYLNGVEYKLGIVN